VIALLMCGGKGSRLGKGEKPLREVCGKKLVDHALDELRGYDIIAVTSPHTPKTRKYLLNMGVDIYKASGLGFIEDYREACIALGICEPVFIVSSDIIYFRHGIVDEALETYLLSTARALKVVSRNTALGINILDAYFIDEEQKEEIYRISELDAININTVKDIKKAEEVWMYTKRGEKGWQKD